MQKQRAAEFIDKITRGGCQMRLVEHDGRVELLFMLPGHPQLFSSSEPQVVSEFIRRSPDLLALARCARTCREEP